MTRRTSSNQPRSLALCVYMKQTFFATPGSPLVQTTQSWDGVLPSPAWEEADCQPVAATTDKTQNTVKTTINTVRRIFCLLLVMKRVVRLLYLTPPTPHSPADRTDAPARRIRNPARIGSPTFPCPAARHDSSAGSKTRSRLTPGVRSQIPGCLGPFRWRS